MSSIDKAEGQHDQRNSPENTHVPIPETKTKTQVDDQTKGQHLHQNEQQASKIFSEEQGDPGRRLGKGKINRTLPDEFRKNRGTRNQPEHNGAESQPVRDNDIGKEQKIELFRFCSAHTEKLTLKGEQSEKSGHAPFIEANRGVNQTDQPRQDQNHPEKPPRTKHSERVQKKHPEDSHDRSPSSLKSCFSTIDSIKRSSRDW